MSLKFDKSHNKLLNEVYKYGYAEIEAIDCSQSEITELKLIGGDHIKKLELMIRDIVKSELSIPSIQIMCVGQASKLDRIPSTLRSWIEKRIAYGMWLTEHKLVVALFQERISIGNIIIHELTHALLEVLTNGFRYPLALQEGLARRMEYKIIQKTSKFPRDRGAGDNGLLVKSEFMSIHNLLCIDKELRNETDPKIFLKLTRASFWFNTFLMTLTDRHPHIKMLYIDLWKNNITTTSRIIRWLEDTTKCSVNDLEKSFLLYCTKGTIMDK